MLATTGGIRAEELVDRTPFGKFSIGIAIGNFDTDTDDSNDPHLNEIAYSAIFGAKLSRYLAIDAELQKIESGRGFDDFGDLTSFGAKSVGVSLRVQYPLADDFVIYLRSGAARFDLDDDSMLRDENLDSSYYQPMYGGGVRGDHWFLEYVNYGEIEELYVEQLRAGFVIRF